MAAVTGRLGDGPGLAIVDADAAAVHDALTAAAREHAPLIVVAQPPPSESAPTKVTIVATADSAAHWVAHAAQAAMGEPSGCVWLVVPSSVARVET